MSYMNLAIELYYFCKIILHYLDLVLVHFFEQNFFTNLYK